VNVYIHLCCTWQFLGIKNTKRPQSFSDPSSEQKFVTSCWSSSKLSDENSLSSALAFEERNSKNYSKINVSGINLEKRCPWLYHHYIENRSSAGRSNAPTRRLLLYVCVCLFVCLCVCVCEKEREVPDMYFFSSKVTTIRDMYVCMYVYMYVCMYIRT
jgi:hypothetical protein